jgi:hypothetical protein
LRYIASDAKYSHSRHISPLPFNQIAKAFRRAEFYFLCSENDLNVTQWDFDFFGRAIAPT